MSSTRYLLQLLGTLVVATAAVVATVQWAWLHFELFARISPMRYQLHLVERSASGVEVLAIGDSHAALGLYPDRPEVINAAFAGETLREMRVKLDYLRPRLPRLKVVLLQSQPPMLFPYRDRPVAEPYRRLVAKDGFHPFEHWLLQFDPCCRARSLREAVLAVSGRAGKGPGPDVLSNGYLDYSPYVKYDRARFGELATAEVASYHGTQPVQSLAADFTALVDDLLAGGIRVVLVHYPLSRSYWSAIGEDRMRTAEELFARVARERGLSRCGSWQPQPDELHFNPDHLTLAGAQRYWRSIERCALGKSQSQQ